MIGRFSIVVTDHEICIYDPHTDKTITLNLDSLYPGELEDITQKVQSEDWIKSQFSLKRGRVNDKPKETTPKRRRLM